MSVALSIKNIRKTYGRVVAVDDCSFNLREAEIHVLLGTNGCGKSTLCKIIAGAIHFDEGTFSYFGQDMRWSNPLEARQKGIATVYQELSLNPTQTVAENIFLGSEPATAWFQDKKAMQRKTDELFDRLSPLCSTLKPEMLVGNLSIDQRQIVEIAKALVLQPKIILFDESTSSLDLLQVRSFFDLVRQLKREGCSIIFISHRMEEIFAIGDRVTVMRNGRNVHTVDIAATDRRQLIDVMIGEGKRQKPTRLNIAKTHTTASAHENSQGLNVKKTEILSSPLILEVENLTTKRIGPLSLSLHQGEILGLGGLHGQGQSELLLALLGDVEMRYTHITYQGKSLRGKTPRARLAQGFAYVSGDRGRDGALRGRSIFENLIASLIQKNSVYSERTRKPTRLSVKKTNENKKNNILCFSGTEKDRVYIIGYTSMWQRVTALMQRLKLHYDSEHDAIESLSGGNQQKVIVGRAFVTSPRVLLLDDPTKGIDVAAKADLFALIRQLRHEGVGVILYSSEDSELLEYADRIAVFNSGRITAMLEGEDINEFNLYAAALEHRA